jgi:hypothetical protein
MRSKMERIFAPPRAMADLILDVIGQFCHGHAAFGDIEYWIKAKPLLPRASVVIHPSHIPDVISVRPSGRASDHALETRASSIDRDFLHFRQLPDARGIIGSITG